MVKVLHRIPKTEPRYLKRCSNCDALLEFWPVDLIVRDGLNILTCPDCNTKNPMTDAELEDRRSYYPMLKDEREGTTRETKFRVNLKIILTLAVLVFIVGALLWFFTIGGFESPITPWNILK